MSVSYYFNEELSEKLPYSVYQPNIYRLVIDITSPDARGVACECRVWAKLPGGDTEIGFLVKEPNQDIDGGGGAYYQEYTFDISGMAKSLLLLFPEIGNDDMLSSFGAKEYYCVFNYMFLDGDGLIETDTEDFQGDDIWHTDTIFLPKDSQNFNQFVMGASPMRFLTDMPNPAKMAPNQFQLLSYYLMNIASLSILPTHLRYEAFDLSGARTSLAYLPLSTSTGRYSVAVGPGNLGFIIGWEADAFSLVDAACYEVTLIKREAGVTNLWIDGDTGTMNTGIAGMGVGSSGVFHYTTPGGNIYEGAGSLQKPNLPLSPYSPFYITWNTTNLSLSSDTVYRLSCWVKLDSDFGPGEDIQARLEIKSGYSDATIVQNQISSIPDLTTWEYLEAIFTTGSDLTGEIGIYAFGAGLEGFGSSTFIDKIEVYEWDEEVVSEVREYCLEPCEGDLVGFMNTYGVFESFVSQGSKQEGFKTDSKKYTFPIPNTPDPTNPYRHRYTGKGEEIVEIVFEGLDKSYMLWLRQLLNTKFAGMLTPLGMIHYTVEDAKEQILDNDKPINSLKVTLQLSSEYRQHN